MATAAHAAGLTRQACDRCRTHKLRCTRDGDAGACDRCLRKGSACTYSVSLPKGRRSAQSISRRGGRAPSISGDSRGDPSDDGSRAPSMDWDGFAFELTGHATTLVTDAAFDCLNAAADASLCDIGPSNPPSFPHMPTQQPQLPPLGSRSSNSSSGLDDAGDSEYDPEVLLARLAQLSTQISSLRRAGSAVVKSWASSSFAHHMQTGGHPQAGSSPPLPIHDAVFQSVATWLARGPVDNMPPCPPVAAPHAYWAQTPKITTLGDLLYHLFSSSYHLPELLQLAPNSSATSSVADSTPEFTSHLMGFAITPMNMDGAAPLTPESGQASMWKPTPAAATASSNNAVRHLLIASHAMLLNIYADVLDLLQRYVGPTPLEGSAPLQDVRLVSVVQLCSFLIDRQHQAVCLYLSSSSSSNMERETVPDTMDAEAMKSLKAMRTEMGQRIRSLQQTLRI